MAVAQISVHIQSNPDDFKDKNRTSQFSGAELKNYLYWTLISLKKENSLKIQNWR